MWAEFLAFGLSTRDLDCCVHVLAYVRACLHACMSVCVHLDACVCVPACACCCCCVCACPQGEELLAQVREEIRLADVIKHPNIIRFVAHAERPFARGEGLEVGILMEYCSGARAHSDLLTHTH